MQQVDNATPQHQRGEGAPHPYELWVVVTLGMDPVIERIYDLRSCGPYFHSLGNVAESIQKAAHSGLSRDAAALCARDSVSDCRRNAPVWRGQLRGENGADEVFVAITRPGLGAETDARLDAGKTFCGVQLEF
jgi:hypothetical protein